MRVRLTRSAPLTAMLLPAVLLVAGACGSGGPSPAPAADRDGPVAAADDGAAPAAAASPAAAVPGPVPATLAFTGSTLDGRPFDARALAGRPTVLWFWAPWCATCFGQASSVADGARQYAGQLNFLGVAGLGQAKEMAEFVSEGEVGNVTHLNDQSGTVWKKFAITEQSQFVMLDQTGKMVQKGYLDSETLGEWLAHLAKLGRAAK